MIRPLDLQGIFIRSRFPVGPESHDLDAKPEEVDNDNTEKKKQDPFLFQSGLDSVLVISARANGMVMR